MSIVKIKTKGQVTLPTAIRQQVGLVVGDLLEARVERGKITLTPKSLVDRRIGENLEDVKKGRTAAHLNNDGEAVAALRKKAQQ